MPHGHVRVCAYVCLLALRFLPVDADLARSDVRLRTVQCVTVLKAMGIEQIVTYKEESG